MKKIPAAFVLFCLSCLTASAQQAGPGGYRFDNFDVPGGVRVETPAQVPALVRQNKRLKLTARAVPAAVSSAPSSSAAPALQMAAGTALEGFSTGNSDVDRFIVESSNKHGVDPLLIYSIMHRESSFKKFALSHKGARGLMQLMPATAARLGVRDIFDPRQNIEGGVKYMRILLDMFDGDVRLALAGYNAGEGAVLKYRRSVPPYRETQEYVRRISQRYALMRAVEGSRISA